MRLLIVFCFLSIFSHAQPFEGYVPPGTVHFSGNLFIDITEVSNLHWQEFEYYAHKDSTEEFRRTIIPSGQVTKLYRPNYYRNSEFRDFPVVGITQKQAKKFCSWRSEAVNERIQVMYNNNALSVNLRVKYRLPTELEWTLIAKELDTMRFTKPREYLVEDLVKRKDLESLQKMLKDESLTLRKIKPALKEHMKNDSVPYYKVDYTRPWFGTVLDQLPLTVYFPDEAKGNRYKKPINLIGNVAEMVKEPGITKGGSWRHQLAVSFPSKSIAVNPTSVYDWVGFRCICEVYYAE